MPCSERTRKWRDREATAPPDMQRQFTGAQHTRRGLIPALFCCCFFQAFCASLRSLARSRRFCVAIELPRNKGRDSKKKKKNVYRVVQWLTCLERPRCVVRAAAKQRQSDVHRNASECTQIHNTYRHTIRKHRGVREMTDRSLKAANTACETEASLSDH